MEYMAEKEIERGYMTKKEARESVIEWTKKNIEVRPKTKSAGGERNRQRPRTDAQTADESSQPSLVDTENVVTDIERRERNMRQPGIMDFFIPSRPTVNEHGTAGEHTEAGSGQAGGVLDATRRGGHVLRGKKRGRPPN